MYIVILYDESCGKLNILLRLTYTLLLPSLIPTLPIKIDTIDIFFIKLHFFFLLSHRDLDYFQLKHVSQKTSFVITLDKCYVIKNVLNNIAIAILYFIYIFKYLVNTISVDIY